MEKTAVDLRRRGFLAALGMTAVGSAAMIFGRREPAAPVALAQSQIHHVPAKGIAVERQHERAMDPLTFLSHFDRGRVEQLPDGRTLREYTIVAQDQTIEVARAVRFAAWTFNGTVPGPTLRATEGDVIRVRFANAGSHTHSVHFHGIHPADMDGVFEQIAPGNSYTYEFAADPFGLFLYHCHTMPVSTHIKKGLYGTLIIDPPQGRPRAHEMVMVMNGFDVDLDGAAEFYTVNGIANYYLENPIRLRVGEPNRVYLVNLLEEDPINSFHMHANMFRWYPHGTQLDHYELRDTVMLCQGERGVMEFSFKHPGRYIFHAHQNEFSELGWVGAFEVIP